MPAPKKPGLAIPKKKVAPKAPGQFTKKAPMPMNMDMEGYKTGGRVKPKGKC